MRNSAKGADAPAGACAILGVKPGASIQEARAAWLRLVKELHPDTGFHDAAASEQLKAINLAYQTLKDLKQYGSGRRPQPGIFRGVRATFVVFLFLPVVTVALFMAMRTYQHQPESPQTK